MFRYNTLAVGRCDVKELFTHVVKRMTGIINAKDLSPETNFHYPYPIMVSKIPKMVPPVEDQLYIT